MPKCFKTPCFAAQSTAAPFFSRVYHIVPCACHLQAVLMLEASIATRPYSGTMRLALAGIYTLLACPERVHTNLRALEVKHIQMDTLAGHHLLPALAAFAAVPGGPAAGAGVGAASVDAAQLRRLLKESLALYDDHHKDAGDTLFTAYKQGTYSKVGGARNNQLRCRAAVLMLSYRANPGFWLC